VWVNWDWDIIFPMKRLGAGERQGGRAGAFVGKIIHQELEGKAVDKIGFDVENSDSFCWASMIADTQSSCKEFIIQCGLNAISKRFRSDVPVELECTELFLGDDMKRKLDLANMNPDINGRFFSFNQSWNDSSKSADCEPVLSCPRIGTRC